MDPIVRFKDFSATPEPTFFIVNGERFDCVSEIALDSLAELAQLAQGSTTDTPEMMRKIHDLFDAILIPDSAALFRQRCARPTKEAPNPNPIGIRAITDILPWLMEVYGLRPTQPSDESSPGSGSDDTSSTDGASLTASTS